MRVVLDTDVLLSGLAYPRSAPGRIVQAWRRGAIEVVLSAHLLDELARVLPRLGRRLALSDSERQDLIDSLAVMAELVDLDAASLQAAGAAGLRDAADTPVLAALIAAQAQYLVTGDKDLLALDARYPIVTPAEFCRRHAP